jgi:geranyl-CoA carboxylase alpha subunit
VANHEVRIGDNTVTIQEGDFSIEPLGDGVYSVSDGATRWRVVVAGPSDDRWVHAEGQVARVEILARSRGSAKRRTTAHEMSAPMPATVVKVYVEPGAAVRKGDTVIMLEAMKMELPVRASRDGIVRTVSCRPGELVQPGVNLVELEP